MVAHGWVRDLSENGLRAFVAEPLVAGETVSLLFSLPTFGKEEYQHASLANWALSTVFSLRP